jgi:hypothetical protein
MTTTCDYCGWAPATTSGDLPNWGVHPLCDYCFNLMGYPVTTPVDDAIPVDADWVDIDPWHPADDGPSPSTVYGY